MSQLLRTMTLGWKLHFKQESRNPFFLYIVIGTPLIYATMAYFLFQGGEQQATLVAAAVGSAMMGIWSLTTTAAAAALQRQRRLGILELLVASPTPFWATFLPITLAIALDRDLLARHGTPLRPPPLRRARVGGRLARVHRRRARRRSSRSGCSAS